MPSGKPWYSFKFFKALCFKAPSSIYKPLAQNLVTSIKYLSVSLTFFLSSSYAGRMYGCCILFPSFSTLLPNIELTTHDVWHVRLSACMVATLKTEFYSRLKMIAGIQLLQKDTQTLNNQENTVKHQRLFFLLLNMSQPLRDYGRGWKGSNRIQRIEPGRLPLQIHIFMYILTTTFK